MSNDSKQKTTSDLADQAIKEIKKIYGNDSIRKYGDVVNQEIKSISTGSLILDNIIGIGGYPIGRITEVFGPESSGKTTLALHAIVQAQKKGGQVAFIDAEHALDPLYAERLGVKLPELVISQPDSGEQALGILELLIKSGAFSLIVLDSVASLAPKAELDGDISNQTIGAQARLMSKALRKLSGPISKNNCVVIFINQIRTKIGTFFGSNETTSGGRALRFYASLRLELRRVETLKNSNGDPYGNKIRIKTAKNKVGIPFQTVYVQMNYDKGIDIFKEIIDIAVDYQIINKSGVWYYLEKDKLGQGLQKTRDFLLHNPKKYDFIMNKVQRVLKN